MQHYDAPAASLTEITAMTGGPSFSTGSLECEYQLGDILVNLWESGKQGRFSVPNAPWLK